MQKTIFGVLFLLITLKSFSQDFEVAPVVIYFNATYEKPQAASITITNHNDTPQTFRITFSDEYFIDGVKKYTSPGTTENSCFKWITLDNKEVRIGPEEQGEIKITMKPDTKNVKGSKWITGFVSVVDENARTRMKDELKTGIKVIPRIAVKIIQDSGEKENISFSLLKDSFFHNKTSNICTLNIKNNTPSYIHKFKYYYSAVNTKTGENISSKKMQRTVYPKQIKRLSYDISDLDKGTYEILFVVDPGLGLDLEALRKTITIR
jgi:hypothetical protein